MTQAIAGLIKRSIVGQITANGSTEVTISVPNLSADSVVIASLNTVGGTPAGAPYISTKDTSTDTVGFKAAVGDTSVYDILYLS